MAYNAIVPSDLGVSDEDRLDHNLPGNHVNLALYPYIRQGRVPSFDNSTHIYVILVISLLYANPSSHTRPIPHYTSKQEYGVNSTARAENG